MFDNGYLDKIDYDFTLDSLDRDEGVIFTSKLLNSSAKKEESRFETQMIEVKISIDYNSYY